MQGRDGTPECPVIQDREECAIVILHVRTEAGDEEALGLKVQQTVSRARMTSSKWSTCKQILET